MQQHRLWLLAGTALLAACNSSDDDSGGFRPPDLSDQRGYRADGAYRDALALCPGLYQVGKVCTLEVLPPLQVDSPDATPSVEAVMARVAVSHDWMGERFERALALLPEETRTLMRPLSAIVIDADIRPSFFMPTTGAIYLDPKYLWLTQAEKDTISDHDDHRGAYAGQMTTLPAWRYVDGDDYAYSSNEANSRTEEDMVQSLARLLFHELAHANDFIETERLADLPADAGFNRLIDPGGGQMSAAVQRDAPLRSQPLLDYAAALYLGAQASLQTTSLRGASAGAELASEGANATYGYATRYEDFAMLVEETLMQRHYGFRRDTAYIEQRVTGVGADGSETVDNVVHWGQRGRIGDTRVKPRARAAMQALLPAVDWRAHFDALATPQMMNNGLTWADNLRLSSDGAARLSADDAWQRAAREAADFASPHQ